MSRTSKRDTTPADTGSADQRLARFLDSPLLARAVPYLPPETLHQLIQHRGLDACGEIVTSATPAQLTSLLDLDLWRQGQPGRDYQFDVGRFGEWIEVLVDMGSAAAARTVAALDPDVVVAGLSRLIRVVDPGIFEPTAQSDDEATDRHEAMREGDLAEAGSDGLECEVGGYLVRARRPEVCRAGRSAWVESGPERSPRCRRRGRCGRRCRPSQSTAGSQGSSAYLPRRSKASSRRRRSPRSSAAASRGRTSTSPSRPAPDGRRARRSRGT